MNLDRREIFKRTMVIIFWVAFVALFFPFYAEILLAGVFALAMEPFLGRWLQNRHLRWRTSVALILVGSFVVLAVPVTAVAYKAYAYVMEISRAGFQNTPLFQKALVFKTETVTFANGLLEKVGMKEQFDLSGMFEEGLSRTANISMAFLTQTFSQVPSILLSIFIFCAALYFFLAEAAPLERIFKRQKVLSNTEADRFISILQKSSYNTVVSSMLIAVIQSTMVSLGAIIISSVDFIVIWVVTFFCSFIPVIGAGPVAFALGIGEVISGNYGRAVAFVILSVVAGTTDNIIRPFLISSGEEDLHPVVSLLAIIGALIIFGMSGLFLGPVIASVAVKIIPVMYGGPLVRETTTADGKDPS